MSRTRVTAVALGGVAGATLRWVLLELTGTTDFPTATLAANLIACFALGMLVAAGRRDALGIGLATGFCGGLSTMSTLSVEAAVFLDDARYAMFAAYLAASLIGGFATLQLGRRIR